MSERTALDRLREDLAYAAPELHWLHIERRFEEAVDEAIEAERERLQAAIEELPAITMAYPPDDPVHRAAVLALLDPYRADTPEAIVKTMARLGLIDDPNT